MKPEFDAKRMVFLIPDLDEDGNTIYVQDEDGEDIPKTLDLPAQYEVCGRCYGKGTHWHESLSNGITEEDRDRDWDPESWEFLMNGGMDVRCSECKGERVVPVPQDSINSVEAQRALELYNKWMDDERDYRAECEMERRMGC